MFYENIKIIVQMVYCPVEVTELVYRTVGHSSRFDCVFVLHLDGRFWEKQDLKIKFPKVWTWSLCVKYFELSMPVIWPWWLFVKLCKLTDFYTKFLSKKFPQSNPSIFNAEFARFIPQFDGLNKRIVDSYIVLISFVVTTIRQPYFIW